MLDGIDVLQQEQLNYAHAKTKVDEYLTLLTHLHSQIDDYQEKLKTMQQRASQAKQRIDDIEQAKGELVHLPLKNIE